MTPGNLKVLKGHLVALEKVTQGLQEIFDEEQELWDARSEKWQEDHPDQGTEVEVLDIAVDQLQDLMTELRELLGEKEAKP